MSLDNHLNELRKKHRNLDNDVDALRRSPAHCPFELQALKKQKLRLKDKIAAIENAGADLHDLADHREARADYEVTAGDFDIAEIPDDSIQAVG